MSEIIVRHAEPDDAAALHQMYSQPETYSDTLQLPYPSLQRWQEKLKNTPDGQHMLVACINGQIVGQCFVALNTPARRRHTATFGLGVDVRHRGKGVAKAMMTAIVDLCDSWLQVDRIELTVYADNQAAIALYEKFGFVTEGRGVRFGVRNGVQVDALFMARLKD
ncbi:GNAT family N-acetyltransferase [Pantoea coffeiphila]|uniref:GNAT family N-acetyltransferase n=1 Tax=Pantoea coffeiphila TaxID=1465635 RepID=A0A2S9IE27_9GAMM|nr:GNAT family N-acetyltransferase [Pantoea coffeiphila]PRD16041.1 GNAT family N-acetyltransferase [Pantoea coffeiphila]